MTLVPVRRIKLKFNLFLLRSWGIANFEIRTWHKVACGPSEILVESGACCHPSCANCYGPASNECT